MSTSLQQQLKRLKTAPTQSLSVERDYSSLLFDKQEAASHSRDDFYKIGISLFKFRIKTNNLQSNEL